tara:strand:+ start:144 stop:503 length:360 start_codon:yes stop_codon:yes gene_type:complete
MIENSKYGRVSWRKYLVEDYHPRVKNFLESRGDGVFSQIAKAIEVAIQENKPEIAILVHPNVNNVAVIKKSEYHEVLNLSLKWFVKKEDYVSCHKILEVQTMITKRNKTESSKITKTQI